jgi:hypothetical protein
MRVTVLPHKRIKPLLAAWRRSLGDTREQRDQLASRLWGEFVDSIVAAKGPPHGSIEDDTRTPLTYWCNFPGVGVAQLLVEPDRRVGFFRIERRVVVVNLNFSPGLPG